MAEDKARSRRPPSVKMAAREQLTAEENSREFSRVFPVRRNDATASLILHNKTPRGIHVSARACGSQTSHRSYLTFSSRRRYRMYGIVVNSVLSGGAFEIFVMRGKLRWRVYVYV